MLVAAMSLLAVTATLALAQQAGLDGSWTGGGSVSFKSGEKEKASCRATFSRMGGDGYSMRAVCATAAAKVSQSATLDRSGPNRFIGDFYNTEFGVRGTIRITVNGNQLNAALSSDSGSAFFTLRR
jgi:hypothetical protein